MLSIILSVLITASGSLFYEESQDDWFYDCISERAVNDCKYRSAEDIDPEIISLLINVEKEYNVPSSLKGMLLAAACTESGYNALAAGDKKFSKSKKKPMAIGILQLWPIYVKMYKIDRKNPTASAHAWMKHIVSKLKKIDKQCGYKTQRRRWIAAWVTGIRYKKPGGRCKERPTHLKTLNRWHRHIENYGCGEDC